MEVTTRSGRVLMGRAAELYSGQCPPERPCPPEEVALFQQQYDSPDGPPPAPPPAPRRSFWRSLGQAVSYGEALLRWQMAGRPETPPEELAKRKAACAGCIYFDAQRIGCRYCGCGIDAGSLEQKWMMATESCPSDPPLWLAVEKKS